MLSACVHYLSLALFPVEGLTISLPLRFHCHSLALQADEYDNCFLSLSPSVAVVTNVEWEHVDFFPDEVCAQLEP